MQTRKPIWLWIDPSRACNLSCAFCYSKRSHTDGMIVKVQGIRLGPIALIGMPGEVLAETGKCIGAAVSEGLVLAISGANDYVGYLPLLHATAEGGYEAQSRILGEEGILRCVQAARQLAAEQLP